MFTLLQITGFHKQTPPSHLVLQGFFPHIDNSSCLIINEEDKFHFCIRLQLGNKIYISII